MVHYRELDAKSGPWDAVRVNRLCALLRMSAVELARLLRLSPAYMRRCMSNQSFVSPIRLLLDLVEQSAYQKYLGRKPEYNVIPEI